MDRVDIIMQSINQKSLKLNAQYNIYGDFSGLQWLDSRTATKQIGKFKQNMMRLFGF